MSNLDIMYKSNSDSWGTPKDLFDKLHKQFNFTLDGAADESNHLLPRWLGPGSDIAENALAYTPNKDEVIWLNPPYSMCKEFSQWSWANYIKSGAVTVMLLPARTDTKYWHEYIYKQWSVSYEFIKGRLRFNINGVPAKSCAPFPSVLVQFGSLGEFGPNIG